MKRIVSTLLTLVLLAGLSFAGPVMAAPVPGAITWVVDHHARTITVTASYQGGTARGSFVVVVR